MITYMFSVFDVFYRFLFISCRANKLTSRPCLPRSALPLLVIALLLVPMQLQTSVPL